MRKNTAVHTKTSVAVNSYFSFREFKLHNSYDISYADHCTKAVVLPAVVVEKDYKQPQV